MTDLTCITAATEAQKKGWGTVVSVDLCIFLNHLFCLKSFTSSTIHCHLMKGREKRKNIVSVNQHRKSLFWRGEGRRICPCQAPNKVYVFLPHSKVNTPAAYMTSLSRLSVVSSRHRSLRNVAYSTLRMLRGKSFPLY